MSDLIQFECPQCRKSLSAKPQHAGQSTKCPGCDCLFKIPSPVVVTEDVFQFLKDAEPTTQSTVGSLPQLLQNWTDSKPRRNEVPGLFERAANWSAKNSTNRVFESYVTVGYLRWAWNFSLYTTGIVWLVGSVAIILTLFPEMPKNGLEEIFKLFALVPFTLFLLLELFLTRMGLETVAVFFDIAHDIRRLADANAKSEPTSKDA